MASAMKAMYHTRKGARHLTLEQWGDAAAEFSMAIWASGPLPIPEALAGRALSLIHI